MQTTSMNAIFKVLLLCASISGIDGNRLDVTLVNKPLPAGLELKSHVSKNF
jgi:hypothetical protein